MRRSLVLTDETAGHPFLASLPPHVRTDELVVEGRSRLRLTRDDIRGFFAAYIGCFIAVFIFVS